MRQRRKLLLHLNYCCIVDKGKRAYVRNSKRMTSHQQWLNGKIDLEMRKDGRNREERWSSTSDSEMEEGQLRNFGLVQDNEGRAVSHPVKGPIQLPLQDVEGGQITGKDLVGSPSSGGDCSPRADGIHWQSKEGRGPATETEY
ncbi:hypothetical protein Dsin_020330 [Dipteronia sinensis]|uniref:Uncharacterized protein n=1 Tax=Dipteronia sinensis TaxID=43782 RepID=A0AAE0A9T7_9ROSI|nr:hypothetical protein Dsin_020330 [Dipteronia sinensis]